MEVDVKKGISKIHIVKLPCCCATYCSVLYMFCTGLLFHIGCRLPMIPPTYVLILINSSFYIRFNGLYLHFRFLPKEFIECNPPKLYTNETERDEIGYGCLSFGGQRWEEVEKTAVCCRALECIECRGDRTFLREGYPCLTYTNHYFLTTLLYSVLLGFLGLDR